MLLECTALLDHKSKFASVVELIKNGIFMGCTMKLYQHSKKLFEKIFYRLNMVFESRDLLTKRNR